ncbi:MAG TPA: hypothetical protein VFM19_03165 [Candidatus Limnocylindria bacterium]|nr:hypothetical protein [Candidatus Limnocylindria bacterium]
MRRSLPAVLVVLVGLVLLLDLLVANPTLASLADALVELVVILFAAAAVLGAVALAVRHGRAVALPADDRIGSVVVLVGMAAVLVPGLLAPEGAAAPAVRWVVGALLVPLGASLLALVVIFLVPAARRGMRARPAETGVLLGAACVMLVLLLPLGGAVGDVTGAAADWLLAVPVRGVLAGLLVGAAIATAVFAARVVFGLANVDD